MLHEKNLPTFYWVVSFSSPNNKSPKQPQPGVGPWNFIAKIETFPPPKKKKGISASWRFFPAPDVVGSLYPSPGNAIVPIPAVGQ